MSVPEQNYEKFDLKLLLKSLGWLLGAILVGAVPLFQHLVFGWIPFLARGLAGASYHSATAVLGLVTLSGFVFGLHRFLAWLNPARGPLENSGQRFVWSWRNSMSLALLSLLMFVSGTAVVGLTHQCGWLLTSNNDLFSARAPWTDSMLIGDALAAAKRIDSLNNLRSIGYGVLNHSSSHSGVLPAGGTYDKDGVGYHGWMTPILVHVGYSGAITMDKPWNDSVNAPYFKSPIRSYWNPGLTRRYDEQGYALAHFAGSVHVMFPNSAVKLDDIQDGQSQTFLAGEVNDAFVPWGSPGNVRDPARGINRLPDGFGGADLETANMVFIDGSCRRIHREIDPAILKALSTPAGNDRVDE